MRTTTFPFGEMLPKSARVFVTRRFREASGLSLILLTAGLGFALATWSISDPSLNHATDAQVRNVFGAKGAIVADLIMQSIGVSSIALLAPLALLGWRMLTNKPNFGRANPVWYWVLGMVSAAAVSSFLPTTDRWPLPTGLGGVLGDAIVALPKHYFSSFGLVLSAFIFLAVAILSLTAAVGLGSPFGDFVDESSDEKTDLLMRASALPAGYDKRRSPSGAKKGYFAALGAKAQDLIFSIFSGAVSRRLPPRTPSPENESVSTNQDVTGAKKSSANSGGRTWEPQKSLPDVNARGLSNGASASHGLERKEQHLTEYAAPVVNFLIQSTKGGHGYSEDSLEQNARLLEGVLEDFSVKGDVISVHPGPVVTLYEFEPAPGIKSSRVIGLADDIARSMSAVSARVAVVPGRNAIGIELPNPRRETVYLRELVASHDFADSKHKLAIALGKTIGGEPVIVDLAKMPHLLVAGTTGSGKSVAINTMILSLLYRLKPEECRLIMVDPKMLELSVYDGIPHLLTPVVTDPKKAVVALKWAVREMEDRYKKMSKLGVRNIDGFNARVTGASTKGEVISRTVQTGFDRETGEAIYEQELMDLTALPYIVVIVDEMADLMMVAGKEIEGAIQRLAQMARAAGIHIIMATQRPSVDVITGTIKANFPTRISFQVTSKIDSRTILGEMGAEQLLGQGDMLYMAGGGRISRVHGPFVSDAEVERVVAHLKMQGRPQYLDAVTAEDVPDAQHDDMTASEGTGEEGGDLYDRAVSIVLRDKKCSTSYVQRRLSVGYNKAASLVERMEKEGVVGPANHAGKRAILVGGGVDCAAFDVEED